MSLMSLYCNKVTLFLTYMTSKCGSAADNVDTPDVFKVIVTRVFLMFFKQNPYLFAV